MMMCSTCRKREAAVVVVVAATIDDNNDDDDPSHHRELNHPKQTRDGGSGSNSGDSGAGSIPLCLLHYYTSGHARRRQQQQQHVHDPREPIRMNEPHFSAQMADVQRQFAEAFVDIQSEIQSRQHHKNRGQSGPRSGRHALPYGARERPAAMNDDNDDDDPLSVLHRLYGATASRSSSGGRTVRCQRADAGPSAATGTGAARMKGPPNQHHPAAAATTRRLVGRNGHELVDGGGFLTEAVLPDRIERTRRQQAELYRQLEERVRVRPIGQGDGGGKNNNHHSDERDRHNPYGTDRRRRREPPNPTPAAAAASQSHAFAAAGSSATKRRRPSRKSIWNAVLESKGGKGGGDGGGGSGSAAVAKEEGTATEGRRGGAAASSYGMDNNDEPANANPGVGGVGNEGDHPHVDNPHGVECPSCKSRNVRLVGTRGGGGGGGAGSQDQIRGEIWGNKDTNDQKWCRYQCLKCGRIWNEEE